MTVTGIREPVSLVKYRFRNAGHRQDSLPFAKWHLPQNPLACSMPSRVVIFIECESISFC